jgi:hypothetical protein
VPVLPGGGPYFSAVSAGYFEAVGTPLRRGQPIGEEHTRTGARVVVVSEAMAEALWPGAEALGQCVRLGNPVGECWQVIGVVADVHREGYREPPSMQFYVPYGVESSFGGTALVVRPAVSTANVLARVEAALAALDPRIDFVETTPLQTLLEPQIRPWRLGAVVLTLAALLAVIVSLLGVYGVLAQLLAQRRREIGVRLALGASGGSVRGLLLRTGLLTALAGVVLGVAPVVGASRWLGPLLFETPVHDPWVITAVAVLLISGALVACAPAALQAARVDPLTALRSEVS